MGIRVAGRGTAPPKLEFRKFGKQLETEELPRLSRIQAEKV